MEKIRIMVFLSLMLMVQCVDSAGKFPSVFSPSHWIDNIIGDIEFTTWQLQGWEFNISNQTIRSWELVDGSKFEAEGYLALRTDDTFTYSGKKYHAFACLKFEKLGDDYFKYYSIADPLPLLGGARVKVHTSDALDFDDVCDEDYDINKAVYNILIKKGTVPRRTCPDVILGKFSYKLEYPDGSMPCNGYLTEWDGCTDNQVISLRYTTCPYKVAYSSVGKLTCIESMTSDEQDYTEIMAYNLDKTVDNRKTFRFSCIRVVHGSTKYLRRMLIQPGFCREGRLPMDFPQENGAGIGEKLEANEYSSCRSNGHSAPVSDDGYTLTKGQLIGLIVGLICGLSLAVAVGVVVVNLLRK